MRRYFESDIGFYYSIGGLMIAVFVLGIATLSVVNPSAIDERTLVPLTVGFFMFMFVYFVSISIQLLESTENV